MLVKLRLPFVLSVCVLLSFLGVMAQQTKPITNVDITEMVKAGLPEGTIILAIQQAPTDFDTSPQTLIKLKNDGVSPKILDAMLQAKKVGAPNDNQGAKKIERKIVLRSFALNLDECKLRAGDLICRFSVTNEADQDRTFNLYHVDWRRRVTRAIDSNGNEHIPAESSIGVNRTRRGSGFYNSSILVPHIATKVELRFDDISAEINSLRLLRIGFSEQVNGNLFYADFKDIPIIR